VLVVVAAVIIIITAVIAINPLGWKVLPHASAIIPP